MNKARQPTAPPSVKQRPNLVVASFEGFDRAASISVPQELIDDQLAGFTEGEIKVLLAVIRATGGGQRESVPLTVRALCKGEVPDVAPGRGTGLSPRTVQAACASLETAGFLRVTRRMAPDGSGLPSLFSLPLVVPGMGSADGASPRFPGYASGRRVRLPLLVIDRLLAELSGAELKVLLYVLRHTFCLGLPDEVMPMARLVENTGLSLRHTRLAVAGLTAPGFVLVQHRQDAERGKLPSRFGVRVLGEPAPFSALAPAPGVAVRAVRVEEPAEQPRPVWLLPPEPEHPLEEAQPPTPQILQMVPPAAQQQTLEPVRVPLPPIPAPASPQLAASGTPSLAAPRASAAPQRSPTIPPSMLRDGNPVWAAVKTILAERMPYQLFIQWVAPTVSVGSGGAELLIGVRDEHHRWWLESKLDSRVREALAAAGYPDQQLRYMNFNADLPPDNPLRPSNTHPDRH